MESKKITQLATEVSPVLSDLTFIGDPITGQLKKVTLNQIAYIFGAGSAWGQITGVLSNQTDLQAALDAKVPYSGATGNVNLGEWGITSGYYGFDLTPTGTPTSVGTMFWDSFYRTPSVITGTGATTLQLGQEQVTLVHNNTGSTLTDGQVVYVTGSTGELPSVALATNATEAASSVTFGVVTESIAHGSDGFVTTSGMIHGLNTLAFNEGDALWLGATAGTFTNVKPTAPANSVLIGYVIKKAGGNGSIFVKIQNGYELNELHDVLISGVTNNQGLFWDSATSLWKNKTIATALGYTPANDANVVHLAGSETITGAKTFSNTSTFTGTSIFNNQATFNDIAKINAEIKWIKNPAIQTASAGYLTTYATSGMGLSFFDGDSGNESKFIFNSGANYNYTFPAANGTIALVGGAGVGTVTSVAALTLGTSGTDLSSTVANSTTTPVITLNVPTASATNRGALSSADWTTFNNKQNALTNPVTGTGNENYISLFTSTGSTLGNSNIRQDGSGNVIINLPSSGGSDYALEVGGDGYFHGTGIFTESIQANRYANLSIDAGYSTIIGSGVVTSNKLQVYGNVGVSGTVTASNGTLVGGTGTTNYLPKFTGTSTIGNSIIQESSSNIGINQAPSSIFTLDIKATAGTYGFNIRESSGNNSVYITSNINGYNRISSNYMVTSPYLPLAFTARESNSDLVVTPSGNVQIGYGSIIDTYKLDVNGTGRFSGGLNATSGIFNGTATINLKVQNGASANTLVEIHSFGTEAAGEYAGIRFKSATASGNEYAKGLIAFRNNGTGYGRGDLYFNLNNGMDAANATLSDVKMAIKANGQVVINGTNSYHGANLSVANKIFLPFQADADIGGTMYSYNDIGYQTYAGGLRFQVFRNVTGAYQMYDALTIDADGRLGVNTTSPKNKLHVQGNSVTALFSGNSSSLVNEYSGIVISPYSAQAANGIYGVEIRSTITQSTPNYLNPRMDFLVQNTNTYEYFDRGVKMTILGNGNVGIGTTNPDGQLSGTKGLSIVNATNAALGLSNGTNHWLNYLSGTTYRIWNNTSNEVMTILLNGNVGIGTTSPGNLLSIAASTNSGSGSTYPLQSISNTLATQGDGSTTFNFAGLLVQSGNGAVQFYHSTSYASGTWEPQALLNVATNHPLIIRTNNTERMRITSGGNVLIGTTTDNGYKLSVNGTASATMFYVGTSTPSDASLRVELTSGYAIKVTRTGLDRFWVDSDGAGYLKAAAWTYGSDLRLKENIKDVVNGIDTILKLKPKHFDYIDGVKNNLGFIAQDVQKIIPQAVTNISKDNDLLGLKTDFIVPYLVKAIQELKQEIDILKNK